jgi:hypothetical protein
MKYKKGQGFPGMTLQLATQEKKNQPCSLVHAAKISIIEMK